jgi:hypothetical protein
MAAIKLGENLRKPREISPIVTQKQFVSPGSLAKMKEEIRQFSRKRMS